jgi:hypothetical protein
MVEELAELIDDFPGAANQTRCFLHILNLVVKSIIKQFDLPKSKKTSGDDDDGDDGRLDQGTEELLQLAGDIDLEEDLTTNGDEELEEKDDNEEGWIDERDGMTANELDELAASVGPVRLLLTKVQ